VLVVLFALPALVGAWAWRGLALRMGWVDQPDARRLHVQPTPRGGGIGVLLALAMAIPPLLGTGSPYGAILLGLLLTAGGGLLDDLRPLRAVPKLLLQAAGTLPLAWAVPLDVDVFGFVVGFILSWGLAMALVNAWNFMDGSDGLVASQGLLVGAAAVAIGLLAPAVSASPGLSGQPLLVLGSALAGGCLGFLPMNVPRARVFLGDVGSHAIGYAVAALALLAASADMDLQGVVAEVPHLGVGDVRIADALLWLPGSAVVIDTSLTLVGRMLRGERFWLGHREHLYQRAIAAGASHLRVAAAYAGWTLAASALALALLDQPATVAATAAAAVYAAGILIYLRVGRRWPRPERRTESEG
jgi:UDP-N-acetylmuramyl pentapeptide phosphotransferase/UDP-N-acetylglucosamine-1-phosphate transferase